MKKLFVIIIMISLFRVLLAIQIETISGSTLTGEIIKTNSEEVCFVDVRCPKYLFIIKFDFIVSFYENNEDVTLKIINKKVKGKINYNSFIEIVQYDDNTNINLYTNEKKDKPNNSLSFINLSIKTSVGTGKMIRNFNGKTIENNSDVYFSISPEILLKIKNRYHVGIGIIYQSACKTNWGIEDYYHHNSNKTFHNLPVYGLFRADILNHKSNINSYLFTNFGYNRIWGYIFPDDFKLKAGIFAGIGIGVHINNVIVEIAYKHFGSSFIDDDGNDETKLNFEAITISIGYLTK